MSNMSYCRFENTAQDLDDCKDELLGNNCLSEKNEYGDYLSSSEFQKAKELIEMCREIAEAFEGVDIWNLENKKG